MKNIIKYESFKFDKSKSPKEHIMDIEDLIIPWIDDGFISSVYVKQEGARTFSIRFVISDEIKKEKRLTYKSEKAYIESIIKEVSERLSKHNFIQYKIDRGILYVTYKRYVWNKGK